MCIIPGTIWLAQSAVPVQRQFELRLLGGVTNQLNHGTITWPAIDGLSFRPLTDSTNTNRLPIEIEFQPSFLKRLAEEDRINIQLAIPGTNPGVIACRTRR